MRLIFLFSLIILIGINDCYVLPDTVNWNSIGFRINTFHLLIRVKQLNCSQLVDYFIEKSLRYNQHIRALISYNIAEAKLEALRQDEFFYTNKSFVGKLHCVPIIVKDNIDVKGLPTTGGIRALRYSIPNEDAAVVARLRAEGAIVLAKSNLAELGVGVRYDSEMGGMCRNPFDLERNCGASSSGSAASISAGLALLSLGTDTDGSIIGPASFNSLNAIRSPVGAMNMSGIVPLFDYQDTVGPLTKYVDDMVLAYSVMTNESALYENYVRDRSNGTAMKSVRVGYLASVFENFTINTILGDYDYEFDDEVLESCYSFINKLKRATKVHEVPRNQTHFQKFVAAIEPTVLARLKCQDGCLKKAWNRYFGNRNTFEADAPYHSFRDVLDGPLLSDFWKSFIADSNVTDAEKTCDDDCVDYKLTRRNFTQIIDEWFDLADSDVIFYPSYNKLPSKLDSKEQHLSLIIVASYTGYASLNVPIDFSRVSNNSKRPLPNGMTLLAKPENVGKLFLVAKLYENLFKPIHAQLDPNLPLWFNDKQPTSSSTALNCSSLLIILLMLSIRLF